LSSPPVLCIAELSIFAWFVFAHRQCLSFPVMTYPPSYTSEPTVRKISLSFFLSKVRSSSPVVVSLISPPRTRIGRSGRLMLPPRAQYSAFFFRIKFLFKLERIYPADRLFRLLALPHFCTRHFPSSTNHLQHSFFSP